MPVDVLTDIEINRPRAEVSGFASDPDNVVSWYENIESVEWKTPKPLVVGSRLRFVARFLGRRLAYTYEVEVLVPGERFVMSTAEGPFPMATTYTWSDTPEGGTHMTLRNCGEPAGFGKIAAPMMASAMRRANRKDLARLKQAIESREPRDTPSKSPSSCDSLAGAGVPHGVSGWDNRPVADQHKGFDGVLAVWTGMADLADLDSLVTPDYVGFIGSRRRDLARLKADIAAYRIAAPGVVFSIEQQFRDGDHLATRLTAHRVDAAHPKGETIRGLNISRWQNGLLAEEWAVWESFGAAD